MYVLSRAMVNKGALPVYVLLTVKGPVGVDLIFG